MKIYYNPKLKKLAIYLRNNSTLSEVLFWNEIKGKQILGYQFLRQKPIGNYIVDFYCPNHKLVIELDGAQHFTLQGKQMDKERDQNLSEWGFRILRFKNSEVTSNIESVLDRIRERLH